MNILIAKYLWIAGSIIITVLGSVHLYYTFFTDKFSSRNKKVVEEMKTSFPILTNEMTMWKAWISFNATHSAGAIFIGAINFYLALNYFFILLDDYFLSAFSIIVLGFYLWLARKYWFRFIFRAVSVAWLCFLGSYILMLIS
jgi:hypothetical protein